MIKKTFLTLIVIALIFALGIQVVLSQEQEKEELELDASKIMDRLDEILANQTEFFKQFEEIKQELTVIKVRASR